MEVKMVVEIALKAGEILLANGAETYRVEETIERICNSYGVSCECISLATGIFISARHADNEIVSSLKRIRQRQVDLYRIEQVNTFSRSLADNRMDYGPALDKLNEIEKAPCFNLATRLLAACMTAFVYTLFFHGSVADASVAVVITGLAYVILEKISEVGFFQFFEYFLSGLLIGGASVLAEHVLPGISKNNVITGAIMILVPGVALTNGIKDSLYGDYTSGLTRIGEAVLILAALGVGIGTALAIGIRLL